ncbi:MAG: hypothetical protein HN509_10130 [Halobacteriovoraceae bacterium]|jgi:hypothetical protein|nr:hypothetical protein [Halobacteriovoraceae bacterium]MBT5095125.1 hypothetical protein [Halobacteriovoraceae bacterium]
MADISVGKEVLSHCNKCKLALAHIVVTMKTKSTLGKVECKTCGNTHAYKDPSKVKAKKSQTGGTKRAKSATKQSISDLWLVAVNQASSKSQPYSIRACFKLGDIIDHPKFGPGVIERLIDADKIEVIFRHEIKTLMHNK